MEYKILSRPNLDILEAVQENGRIPNVELAERVGLSPTPCLRRLRELESSGIIRGYTALLDWGKAGFECECYVGVAIEKHRRNEMAAFEAAIAPRKEVLSCSVLTGDDYDYLLRVAAKNMAHCRAFLNELWSAPGVARVNTAFVLKKVKETTALPLSRLR